MMANNGIGYVSVIGPNLMEAVLELVEKLESATPVEPNEVQTTSYENGLSCSIAVLSVFVLESALNSIKNKRQDADIESAQYFGNVTSNRELEKDIIEAIVVRNAVAHNHLWEGDVFWDDGFSMKFTSPPEVLEKYKRERLLKVMDPNTRLTYRLKLNLLPPRIWRRDAYVVLKLVVRALEVLEPLGLNFKMSQRYYRFRNEFQSFNRIIENLPY